MGETELKVVQQKPTCVACRLRKLCLFGGVDSAELIQLEKYVKRSRPLRAGEHIFRVGDPLRIIYIVLSGSIKNSIASAAGGEQVVGFRMAGDWLGLDGSETACHTTNAEVLDTTVVCQIPYAQLDELCSRFPSFRSRLVKQFTTEIQREHEHLLVMAQADAEARLAMFLLSLSTRLKARGLSPLVFVLSMRRCDLANYLGIAPETVSRLFTRLQADGTLHVDRREVTIENFNSLQAIVAADETRLSSVGRARVVNA